MKITKIETVNSSPNHHNIDARNIYNTKHASVTHLTLQAGESLKRHITPVDVFFYVLEGTGIVEIGDAQQEVHKDTIIESPAKIPHCLYNKSNSVFRVLVAKVPRPTNSTVIL
ncbi:MAG: cupin domain-containing protein [Nanoarchaeota archaeon]|nr:cupin domain-containing protein [Nanoarchaeota archaeon]